MSGMGNPADNRGNDGGGNANFDQSSMGSNRDPWNRPLKQTAQRDNSGEGDKGDKGNGDGKSGNDNNGGIDDDLIANIWDKIENKDNNNNSNGNGNNGNNGNNQQPTPGDDDARLKKYLSDNGLGGFSLTDAEKEAAGNGDFSPMLTKVNEVIVNAHMKALSGAQTMIQTAVRNAVAEVTEKSNANFAGHRSLEKMNEALPFTKEKHIAPVANGVLQKFLDRKMPIEKAIEGVEAYFNDMASRVSGSRVNTNRNQGFGNNQNTDKKQNWLTVLAPDN